MTYINERALQETERLLGEDASDFVEQIASSDFESFVRILESLGVEHISENGFHELANKDAGIFSGLSGLIDSSRYSCFTSILSNLVIEARYPFVARRAHSGKLSDTHNTTMLQDMPSGWQARFGLELCEDIRSALLRVARDADEAQKFMEDYLVEQVKEKFGSLRWYDACVPSGASDDIDNLICLYERLSMGTCCVCGSFIDVATDNGGYVLPECFVCREAADRRLSRVTNGVGTVNKWIDDHDFENPFFYIPNDIYEKIFRAEIARTTHADKTIDNHVIIERFSTEGKTTFNVTELISDKGYLVMDLIKKHDEAINKLNTKPCDKQDLITEYLNQVEKYKSRYPNRSCK